MKPKISVILPSLNVADYIDQCVESVRTQTLKEIEIICIDAGSDDGTLEKLRGYESQDKRIKVLISDKRSYGYQMNMAIKEAEGDYIGIVETDDFIDPDMYEVLYENSDAGYIDVIKGILYDLYEHYDGNGFTEILVDYIPEGYKSSDIISPDINPEIHYWDGNIWNGIYRREFLLDNDISFNETAGAAFQDIGFQQTVLNKAVSTRYLHAHFYHYRKVREGASTWNPKCLEFIYYEYKKLIQGGNIKESHRRYLYKRMAVAYMYEINKALSYCGYDYSRISCPDAVDWFKDEIMKAFNSGIILFDDIPLVDRNDLFRFILNPKQYACDYGRRMKKIAERLSSIKDQSKGYELAIFGAGEYGTLLTCFLICNGVKVSYIVDNQRNRNDNYKFDIRIMTLDDALRNKRELFFLIANKRSWESIQDQLIQKKVPLDRITHFDGTDDEILDTMLRLPILV